MTGQQSRPGGQTQTAPVSVTNANTIVAAPERARSVPVAQVLKVFPEVVSRRTGWIRSYRTVQIRCPFCRGKHEHGWPNGQEQPGLRVPHCAGPHPSAYYIPKPEAA